MENMNTKDFFDGLISVSVKEGRQRVWSPWGVHAAQPYQNERVPNEKQPTIHEIESENGKKFYVVMSVDGKRCAVSNDELMAFELYWTIERPVEQDGINVSPSDNLYEWEQTTVQIAEGTVGFVRDEVFGSKYVTAATKGTKNLPENDFLGSLETILKAEEEYKERISEMPGEKHRKDVVLGTFRNSIDNIEGLMKISSKVKRRYEENEIKENMALKAKLEEERVIIENKIAEQKRAIKTGNYYIANIAKNELERLEETKNAKVAEINAKFGDQTPNDGTEER